MTRLLIVGFLIFIYGNNVRCHDQTTIEAYVGQTVVLPCQYIGNHHRFMIWQFPDDLKIIGPQNSFDQKKYNYKVLSGELFIKNVTVEDAGDYKCLTQGIANRAAIKINLAKLIVHENHAKK
ncbi:hypothetical protein HCN44_001906 [Aphidius gifuensis]|uniref:Ig-like domain-containing protein n=1 Tax=Aphidius gifuensis TaxID=684658 RepID=A0A835CUL3_APHGI|nr:uncharacterized protein LOC122861148 [Aphidius gifuensis]KAF7996274.1 hypothetical protein HCN44_001906 [Aphidius gifuensis]